jgi:hypothetical protein
MILIEQAGREFSNKTNFRAFIGPEWLSGLNKEKESNPVTDKHY